MDFYWSVGDSKSPYLSRNRLSILSDLNNAVVRMISILPVYINSSSPFTKHLDVIITIIISPLKSVSLQHRLTLKSDWR